VCDLQRHRRRVSVRKIDQPPKRRQIIYPSSHEKIRREPVVLIVYCIYATDRFKMNKLLRACFIYYTYIGIYVCDCILRACTYIKYNISRRQENIRLYILYDNNIIYYYMENVSRIIYPRRWYSRNKFQLPSVGIYSCRGKYHRRTTTGGT